jgi:hypothetical protein
VSFTGITLFEEEPKRECLHEAGHAIVGHHLGMTVVAIGFSWVYGENADPNPSVWMSTYDGFDKDTLAKHSVAGMAAEIVKLGEYDFGACGSDLRQLQELGCGLPGEHYINEAIKILTQKDAAVVRVQKNLMEERINPSYPSFVDSQDHMKKQRHLTQEDFESLL